MKISNLLGVFKKPAVTITTVAALGLGFAMIASPVAQATSSVSVTAQGCGVKVYVHDGNVAAAFQVAKGDTQIGLPVAIPAGGITKVVDVTATGSGSYTVYFNKNGQAVKDLTRTVTVKCGEATATATATETKPTATATATATETKPTATATATATETTTTVPTTTVTAPATTVTTPVVKPVVKKAKITAAPLPGHGGMVVS